MLFFSQKFKNDERSFFFLPFQVFTLLPNLAVPWSLPPGPAAGVPSPPQRIAKSEEVTRGSRKLHDLEVFNFYFASCIVTVIKCWRMKLVVRVAYILELKNAYKILVENLKVKLYLCDVAVDTKMIL